MELGKLKEYFEGFDKNHKFSFKLSEPFSWRGIYAEVAFSVKNEESTAKENLENINKALTDTFWGYKGGEFTYNEYTDVHFEESYGSWTDGGYVTDLIEKITQEEEYVSQEEKFVKLAFN